MEGFVMRHRGRSTVSLVVSLALATALVAGLERGARAGETETLPSGVTARTVTFYSEAVACYGRILFPAGFDPEKPRPGVVLANGWTGTAGTLERYAERFAEHGLVAMAIDYRGWGKSGGFVTLAEPLRSDDRLRITEATARVRIERTRLLPRKQIEDIRNAISYLQGEPGVDRDRIGLWGTSYAGGHVLSVAAIDPRVKVGVAQVPAIAGKDVPEKAFALTGELRGDAIRRARTGQGGVFETGFSRPVTVDLETRQAAREYLPFHSLDEVPESFPVLFVIAENEELMDNAGHAVAAAERLRGPTKVVVLAGITHFEVYRGEPFETGARAAAEWLVEWLGAR
jgi:hypothetical protein